jgi:hypothetical protein
MKAASGTISPVDVGVSDFRVDACRYSYQLAPRELGVGVYRVDIGIYGIMVGHAVFSLK